MRSALLKTGRRLALALEPGDDVVPAIAAACAEHGVAQGVIVTFSGAFRDIELIAAYTPSADPEPPLPESVHVRYTEGIGSGTITSTADGYGVHVHVAAGRKDAGGQAYAGHLISAEAHYVVEVVIDEVLAPKLTRTTSAATFGIPALDFLPSPA